MTELGVTRILLRIATAAVLAFLYLPLVILAIYAFNESRIQAWPPTGFTLHWFGEAVGEPGVTQALINSIIVGDDRDRDRAGPRARSRRSRSSATTSSAARRSRSSSSCRSPCRAS